MLLWAKWESCWEPSNDPHRTHLRTNLSDSRLPTNSHAPLPTMHIRKLVGPWKSPRLALLCQRGNRGQEILEHGGHCCPRLAENQPQLPAKGEQSSPSNPQWRKPAGVTRDLSSSSSAANIGHLHLIPSGHPWSGPPLWWTQQGILTPPTSGAHNASPLSCVGAGVA